MDKSKVTTYSIPGFPDMTLEMDGERATLLKKAADGEIERKPAVILKTHSSWIAVSENRVFSLPRPIESFCTSCSLCDPPYIEAKEDTVLDYIQDRSKYPTHSSQHSTAKSLLKQTSELFLDPSDSIQYIGKTTTPTCSNLANTIDRCLIAYFHLQYDLMKAEKIALPSHISQLIDLHFKKGRQKLFVLPLPERAPSFRGTISPWVYPSFAINAQMLILSQRLFLRQDASTVLSSPQHLCCFISHSTLSKLTQVYNKYFPNKKPVKSSVVISEFSPYQNRPFVLEDYILFERITSCSLFVEITAALLSVDNVSRDICLETLKDPRNLGIFVSCPCLFSRIAVARQFIFETADLINRHFKSADTTDENCNLHMRCLAQKVLNFFVYLWARPSFDPACFSIEDRPELQEEKTICRDDLFQKINDITAPVNLAAYMQNPVYGPVAFCNPKHTGITPLLEDIQFFNSIHRQTPQWDNQKPEWHIFAQLYKTADQLAGSPLFNHQKSDGAT